MPATSFQQQEETFQWLYFLEQYEIDHRVYVTNTKYCTTIDSSFCIHRWRSSLVIPAIASLASVVLLTLQVFAQIRSESRRNASRSGCKALDASDAGVKGYIEKQGGLTIFSFKLARLIGSVTLFSLNLLTILMESGEERGPEIITLLAVLATYVCVPNQSRFLYSLYPDKVVYIFLISCVSYNQELESPCHAPRYLCSAGRLRGVCLPGYMAFGYIRSSAYGCQRRTTTLCETHSTDNNGSHRSSLYTS